MPNTKKFSDIKHKKDQIVVLQTDLDPLVIRGNPSTASVRRFVKEHHRRYLVGEPGGPDGSRARCIQSAMRYSNELSYLADEPGEPIKIEDITSKSDIAKSKE